MVKECVTDRIRTLFIFRSEKIVNKRKHSVEKHFNHARRKNYEN